MDFEGWERRGVGLGDRGTPPDVAGPSSLPFPSCAPLLKRAEKGQGGGLLDTEEEYQGLLKTLLVNGKVEKAR